MCDPVSISLAVASIAISAYEANQQKHAAAQTAKVQQQQIDAKAQASTNDRLKQAREARASARAAAADAGVSGNSVNEQLNNIMMQSGRDVSRIEANRQSGVAASSQQLKATTSEINGQLAASAASSASSAYGTHLQIATRSP